MRLQAFDFEVMYEPGDKNLADSFSRLAVDDDPISGEQDVVQWLVSETRPTAIGLTELREATLEDEELDQVKAAICSGKWENVAPWYKAATIKDDLSCYEDLVLRGDRIVIPSKLREKVVKLAEIF